MRDIVLMIIFIGLIPIILRRPHVGIYTWCWFSYMNPQRLTWGFTYDFPFSVIIALLTLFGMMLSKGKKSISWISVTIIQLIFILWMTFTTFFSLVPDEAWAEWNRMIKIQLMVFVSMMLIDTRERLQYLVLIIMLSHAFYSVKGGVFVLLSGGQYLVYGPTGSFIADNNALALAIIMILPLMWYFVMQVHRNSQKWVLWTMMTLSSFSVLSSYSRGAFLAVTVMGGYLFLRTRKRIILGVLFIALIAVFINFMPDEWLERMETIQTYEEDASALGRINAWVFAFNLAKDRILGGGFEAFVPDLFLKYAPDPSDVHDAHSIYFEVLGEHGFIGLGFYLLLGLTAFKFCGTVVKKSRTRAETKWASDLASMVQVSLVGYAVGGAFLGLAYYDLYYQLIATVVIASSLVDKELSNESTTRAKNLRKVTFVKKTITSQ